jgi:FemAB-related protein (PEP-CTERM system-associated)
MSAGSLGTRPAPVEVHDRPTREACDRYVASHGEGSAYHSPAWLELIGRAFGHDTRYLVAESGGSIAGVLPLVFFRSRLFGRFAVSLPFVNYGGVLADSGEAARALVDRAIEETRNAGGSHLELRHTAQRFPELTARRHKVAMILDVEPTSGRQWDRLDRKVRNQIRKAEKSALQGEHGGLELVDAFYDVFAHNMRDLGTPVYGIRFFREVLATFPDVSRVFLVRQHGRPIAASIVHWHGSTIEVPWASSIREFNPLCSNVLLYWHMIAYASDHGLRRFDFGRSTPGEGTFHFKRQWGAEPHELVWEYWAAAGTSVPDLSPKNPTFSFAIKAWQRLPVGIATAIGPHIVRNIP